jgi:tetratricopeptide (TPR) repeat protein
LIEKTDEGASDLFAEEKLAMNELFPNEEKFAFLVGAGISTDPPSNVPSARMFVSNLFKQYAPEEEFENLLNLEGLRYELVVEEIQKLFDKDLKFLNYLDLVKDPNLNHLFLAKMIELQHAVITTNFDYLIEFALKQCLVDKPFLQAKMVAIITKSDYDTNTTIAMPVVKIHGSKKDMIKTRSTIDSLVTTISALGKNREKGKTFALEPYKKKFLDSFLLTRQILIVMGYSGSDDFDIGPFLKELPYIKRLIWIDHDPTIEVFKEKCYKVKDEKKSGILDSFQDISKLDKMLLEIKSRSQVQVYKIRVKTIEFVRLRLIPHFIGFIKPPEIDAESKIPSFKNWMTAEGLNVSEIQKYEFANSIFFFLGDKDGAQRTALKGLKLAEEKHDDNNKLHFMNALGMIYNSNGKYKEALDSYQVALQLSNQLNAVQEKLAINLNIGNNYFKISDYKNALNHVLLANKLVNKDTPLVLKFAILNQLGAVYQKSGNIENAVRSFEDALIVADKTGALQDKAVILGNLAGIKLMQGFLSPALKYAEEADKIHAELGDITNRSTILNTIGNIYRSAGKLDLALKYFNQAIQSAEKVNDLATKALALNSIGSIYYNQGKFDSAIKFYSNALEINDKIGDLSRKATNLNNIGMIYRSQNHLAQAEEYIKKSIDISETIGEMQYLGTRYSNLASLHEFKREFDVALKIYQKALMFEQQLNNLDGIATQLTNIGGIQGDLGKYKECIESYEKALSICRDLDIKPQIANVLNNLGIVYFKFFKNYEKSVNYLEEAYTIYVDLNDKNKILSTTQNLNFIKRQFESNST